MPARDEINRYRDGRGYWRTGPHPIRPALSPRVRARERVLLDWCKALAGEGDTTLQWATTCLASIDSSPYSTVGAET